MDDKVRTIGGLIFHSGIPPRVVMDDGIGRREIQSGAASLEADEQERDFAILETADGRRAVARLSGQRHMRLLPKMTTEIRHCHFHKTIPFPNSRDPTTKPKLIGCRGPRGRGTKVAIAHQAGQGDQKQPGRVAGVGNKVISRGGRYAGRYAQIIHLEAGGQSVVEFDGCERLAADAGKIQIIERLRAILTKKCAVRIAIIRGG